MTEKTLADRILFASEGIRPDTIRLRAAGQPPWLGKILCTIAEWWDDHEVERKREARD